MINLVKYIDEEFIDHDKSINNNLVLYEKNDSGHEKDKPYSGYLKKSNSDKDYLIISNLENLTSNLFYSKKTPSDCDYIFINLEKKEIYFIEFKGSNQFLFKDVKKQLLSGQKWLEHFCFCSEIDENALKEFKTYNIWWEYSSRACRSIEPFYCEDEDIIKIKGNIFIVSKLRHYMKNFNK